MVESLIYRYRQRPDKLDNKESPAMLTGLKGATDLAAPRAAV
jgi:hypothetical protein